MHSGVVQLVHRWRQERVHPILQKPGCSLFFFSCFPAVLSAEHVWRPATWLQDAVFFARWQGG